MITETENQTEQVPTEGSHGHKPRERRDIASGNALEPWQMIRMAFGPEGLVVPDFSCNYRGVVPGWRPTGRLLNLLLKTRPLPVQPKVW